jgi:hypothetical protein
MLGPILVSLHNIRFFQRLMADVRRAIGEGTFDQWRRTDPRAALGPSSAEVGVSADAAEGREPSAAEEDRTLEAKEEPT